MTASLARYHARAPRYILNTENNSLVRLSGAEQFPWEERTELRDVSLTGLSFLAQQDLSPQIGEVIKIQFSVPGAQQMACYAVVIRIEKINQFENLIGVHFYKLDRAQRLNLVHGLAEKVIARTPSVKQQRNHPAEFSAESSKSKRKLAHIGTAIGVFISLLCWLILMKIYFLK